MTSRARKRRCGHEARKESHPPPEAEIASIRLNPENWLVCKDTPDELVLEHKISGNIKRISKELLK